MDLGCPLLRGSSDRRLRRRVATLPPLLERTFPGSIFFSVFVAVTVAMQDFVEENRSFWARHSSKKYHCQSLCKTLLKALTFIGGVDIVDGFDGFGDCEL